MNPKTLEDTESGGFYPLQPAKQDAGGDDLDARVAADAAFHPRPIPDALPDPLADISRHAHRGRARRQPPRLQHLIRHMCLDRVKGVGSRV